MIRGPGLAGSLFVAAKGENDEVGFLSHPCRFGDAPGIESWIGQHNLIGIPIGQALGNLAAFSVENFRARTHLVANGLENAYASARFAAVAAQVESGGVVPN